MKVHEGGSGRGNKGVSMITDPNRPDGCPICQGYMKSSGKNRWRCTNCDKQLAKNPIAAQIEKYNKNLGFNPELAEAHARRCEKADVLILTSAQNNSQTFVEGLASLKQAAKYKKCEIGVIPSHYINMDLWSKEDEKSYCPEITPYLLKSTVQFSNVQIKADVRINPTTVNPLGGKHSHGGKHWLVIGHPQLCREPVATAGHGFPKLMLTTGSISLPNYKVSDVGEKGKWHHCLSAIILEKYKGFVFVRQLSFNDDGSFQDLDVKFTPDGYLENQTIEALTTGDEHVKFNILEKPTYGKGGLTDLLKPKYIVRHDILDGYAGSHHHEKNPMIQFLKHHKGDNDYRKEVEQAIEFINRTTPEFSTSLIVPSNHHDHLTQFLHRTDANKDHTNALFILEMQALMRQAALKNENYDPFYLYAKPRLKCKFEFLDRNEPFYIGDVDHAQHLDVGTNGSKGSARNVAKTPDKITGGHSHAARIFQGVVQVGTSAGKQEYERGLSDHSNTHCIQYYGGKRSLLDCFEGRFYAPRKRGKK